jgi:hypothetical protein
VFDHPIFYLLNFLCSFLCIALWMIPFIFMYRFGMREQREQSLRIVQHWAGVYGFEILRQLPTHSGPFPVRSRNQLAYEVDIRDREGRVRTGWVLCGGFFLGMRASKIDVVWSDPAPPPAAPPPAVNLMWDRELDG